MSAAHRPLKAHRAIGPKAPSPFPPVFIPGVKRFWGAIALKWRLLQIASIIVCVPLAIWMYDVFGQGGGGIGADGQAQFSSGLGFGFALAPILGCLVTLVWVEYDERETNRKRANAVFAVIMAVLATWWLKNRRQRGF